MGKQSNREVEGRAHYSLPQHLHLLAPWNVAHGIEADASQFAAPSLGYEFRGEGVVEFASEHALFVFGDGIWRHDGRNTVLGSQIRS